MGRQRGLNMLGALTSEDAGPLISQGGELASAIAKMATKDKKTEGDKKPEGEKKAKADDSSIFEWFTDNTIVASAPNGAVVAGGVVGAGVLAWVAKKILGF